MSARQEPSLAASFDSFFSFLFVCWFRLLHLADAGGSGAVALGIMG